MTPDAFVGRPRGDGPMTPESLVQDLLTSLRERTDPIDTQVIERAFALAQHAHTGQMRKSGEPYLIHPVRVATTIAGLGLDAESIASGLLHDSVEDSELTVFDLTEEVGRGVANLVDGVTKLGKVPYLSRQEQQAESFRKMLLAMSEDIRVLLVKLADRLDNMRTLEHMPREKQVRIGRETMEIYAPLAHRLGIQAIRCELEDLSFRYLEPAVYTEVRERLDALLASDPDFIDYGLQELRDAFLNPGPLDGGEQVAWDQEIHGPVVFRASVRTPHQVHRANLGTIADLDHVDLANYEIITRDRGTCYYSLGILHAHFKPVPGQFRDHIALPRPNHYRALHTSVINSRGIRRRVLIRSEEMDDVAQRGVVAMLKHKEGSKQARWSNLAWLKQLMDWQGEVTDPHEFIAAVKADLFADEVYVFTPQGDARVFAKGATPIDFAFSIHTDVGTRCSAARVNGQLVPLRYQLRQGDTIEIITSATARPRREWLKMCNSSRARARIKQFLRYEERTRLKQLGRTLITRELEVREVALADLERVGVVDDVAKQLELPRDYRGRDGLYEALGAGLVDVADVCLTLAPEAEISAEKPRDGNLLKRMFRRMSGRGTKQSRKVRPLQGKGEATAPVVIDAAALEGVRSQAPVIQLATCCSPVPGDNLLGYFIPGKGIIAHVETCPTAVEQVADRMYLSWAPGLELERPVTLEVKTGNTVGLLAEMSRVFSHHSVNIKQANCRSYEGGQRAINTFHASVSTRAQLDSLCEALQAVEGVLAVRRVFRKLS